MHKYGRAPVARCRWVKEGLTNVVVAQEGCEWLQRPRSMQAPDEVERRRHLPTLRSTNVELTRRSKDAHARAVWTACRRMLQHLLCDARALKVPELVLHDASYGPQPCREPLGVMVHAYSPWTEPQSLIGREVHVRHALERSLERRRVRRVDLLDAMADAARRRWVLHCGAVFFVKEINVWI